MISMLNKGARKYLKLKREFNDNKKSHKKYKCKSCGKKKELSEFYEYLLKICTSCAAEIAKVK